MTPQQMYARGERRIAERRAERGRRKADQPSGFAELLRIERISRVEVLTAIAEEHRAQLAVKDAEIARLTWLLKGTDD